MSSTITPFWYWKSYVFPNSCYRHDLNTSSKEKVKLNLSIISFNRIDGRYKDIFTNRKKCNLKGRRQLKRKTVPLADYFPFFHFTQFLNKINKVALGADYTEIFIPGWNFNSVYRVEKNWNYMENFNQSWNIIASKNLDWVN